MLSYSENSRKQEFIHPCFPLPQPQKCDSCDSCDSFQRRGYIASLQLSNYKYIYLNYYIYNNLPLKKGKEGVGAENCHNCHNCHTVTLSG